MGGYSMAKREYGQEQPYIPVGIFKLRLPFIHYRVEVSELLQAILMCSTCLGAIPVLTENLGIPFELAWSMVIINGLLYTIHATWGDPVVPGWITPAIPLTLAYITGFEMGPERTQAMIALQIMVGVIFLVMGITGMASKLLRIVPESIKAGILMGAGLAAIIGEFTPGKRFDKTPITIGLCILLSYFMLFSEKFKKMRKSNFVLDKIAGFGMLPAIILAVIVGPIVGEYPVPNIDIFPIIHFPDINGILQHASIFGVGFPNVDLFIKAIPTAIVIYIIAFGDFVTTEALIGEADEIRQDEKIDFNANRSNLLSAVRNLIEGFFCAYPTLAGPLWAAVTASVAERYKEGPDKMQSIFSGVGTFRWATFIAVTLTPVVTLVQPILPAALSATLVVQGFICTRLAMESCPNRLDMGICGVIGAMIVAKGASWGLATGIVLVILLSIKDANKAKIAAEKVENE